MYTAESEGGDANIPENTDRQHWQTNRPTDRQATKKGVNTGDIRPVLVIDQITTPELLEQILLYGNFEIIVENSFGWKQVIIGKVYE